MHQLDFQITVWSDDEELLLALEQFLKLKGAGCLVAGDALTSYANCLGGEIEKIEVGGVDVNWDESSKVKWSEEELEREAWGMAVAWAFEQDKRMQTGKVETLASMLPRMYQTMGQEYMRQVADELATKFIQEETRFEVDGPEHRTLVNVFVNMYEKLHGTWVVPAT